MKKLLLFAIVTVGLASCSTMGFVSTPTEYVDAGREVSTSRTAANFLGLTSLDSDKAAKEMLIELNKKCSTGITNIRTTHSMKNMLIFNSEKMEMTGNCK